MTLVKTKKRVTPHQRRVSGDHHRKSHQYVKTYWPYLPIVVILLGSAAISQFFLSSPLISQLNPSYSANTANLSNRFYGPLLYLIALTLLVWFSIRHYKRIRKLILNYESVLARHYILDAVIAVIIGGLIIIIR